MSRAKTPRSAFGARLFRLLLHRRDPRGDRLDQLWQSPSTILLRVVMGWMYANGGGSLFLAILIHAVDNVCWKQFPSDGSHYNPEVIAIVEGVMALAIVAFAKVRSEEG